jgi:ATP-dependent helicase/nuclease subunit A
MIVANAGSGKTHCLVTRCIQLLQREAKPEEILALTFTRAAATEFLQQLFERLAKAATDPAQLAHLQNELGPDCQPIDAEGCTKLLRALVRALPRLSMGTLDQYFGRIVRAFPFELGLSKEVELLDDADKEENQRRTLERLFAEATKEKGLDEFIETLRQQSRQRADQSALKAISRAATSLQEKFIETPGDRPWGHPGAIWPGGSPILEAEEVQPAAEKFRAEVLRTNTQLDDAARATLEEWLQAAIEHHPPKRLGKVLAAFLKKLTDEGLGKGDAGGDYIAMGRGGDSKRLFLRDGVRERRDGLFRSIAKLELSSKLESSRALHALLKNYEEIYQRSVRLAGQLTFSDLATLLALHQERIDHQHIEYRLDGRYSHWLLDEFQDTSRLQWRIMQPLVDNVVCEDEGRSFFYVGDTKQAIYGWRGGDFELFEQVHDNFKTKRGVEIARQQLPDSWRSDGNIVQVINEVFAPDRLEHAPGFGLPRETIAHWQKAWVVHQAREERKGKGFAQLRTLKVDKDEGDDASQMALDEAVLGILRDVDPVGRGINCAIIVRTRAALEHYVALLRGQKEPIPVAAEGRVNPCLKSPEGLALYALVKFLASPLDRIAEQQFLASPLGFIAGNDTAAFHLDALGLIAESGLAATLSGWVRQAVGQSLIDGTKVEAFIEAASDYDAQRKPNEDLRAFIEFVDHRIEQESETPGVVRVMTTHFSKGLGMDMVILPELGGKGMAELRDTAGISLHRNTEGEIQWGLSLPFKDICAADDTLGAAREHLRARQAYENFCVLYVAMTRAKHALYCLRAPVRDIKNSGRWLQDCFPQGDGSDPDNRTLGNPQWFENYRRHELHPTKILGTKLRPRQRNSPDTSPSSSEGEDVPAGLILGGGAARHLGTEVHELLAQVEWLGEDPDYSGVSDGAAQLVREFLGSDRAAALRRPEEKCIVWRERAFDVEIDGKPVSGIFDRVHLTLGADGKPVKAAIYDFKTDKSPVDLRERYRDQLDAYRKAAAVLLGIAPENVQAEPLRIRDLPS